ncbi:MAG: RNA polymerase sigma factor RpoD/SigA [Spirochaetales bacterium]|nr:RNA polymerase sigma factor RpoD/SigA [Spirochaetales bacterium]
MTNKNYITNTNTQDEEILSTYLKEINRIPLLTNEREYELSVKAKAGDKKARELLITSNLRFVVNVAKKFQGQGLAIEDLIDEGNIGLMIALDKFDPEKGYHFISYAVWWIRQAIMKAICDKGRSVRLPLNRSNELFQIQKAQKYLLKANGEEASLEELAKETGLDSELIGDLLNISRDMISFDAPIASSDDSADSLVGDFIQDDGFGPEELTIQKCLREDIDKVLSTLSEKEKDIITLRFGLNNKAPMSLKEIGEVYNLTKERIRQIEKRALERLQQPQRSKILSTYKIA